MRKYGYIYLTINLLNGRLYVGQNKGVIRLSYLGSGKILKQAIKKYGRENFELRIIAYASSPKMLDALEIKYIAKYRRKFGKFLYNIVDGGGGTKNLKHTIKAKKAIGKASREMQKDGGYAKGIIPIRAIKPGQHLSPETEYKKGHMPTNGFKKGHTPWSKGMTGLPGNHNVPHTEKTKVLLRKRALERHKRAREMALLEKMR